MNRIPGSLCPHLAVLLSIGCRIDVQCAAATPLLALVHPHASLLADLVSDEQLHLEPERAYEVLADRGGNRCWRLVAPAGITSLRYRATIWRPDATEPVLAAMKACPVEALPIDTYRSLNASTYCDTPALMDLAWSRFAGIPAGWRQVQAICDWVHEQLRFDLQAVQPHQRASDALARGAGVCRDFAHLAISLCRCLNLPARYCTGYLSSSGIPQRDEPVDFSAWFEVFLGDRWHVFDARHNMPLCGRVLIARGRDAADVPFLRTFGAHQLNRFDVITEVVAGPSSHRSAERTQPPRVTVSPLG